MKRTYLLTDEIQAIGRAGETGIAVAVNVAGWQVSYPGGVGAIRCTRPDAKQQEISCTITNGLMIGELPDECTSRPGIYQLLATWTVEGAQQASNGYKVVVLSTTDGREAPPGCPGTPAWATQIFVQAEQINAALDAALQLTQYAADAEEARDAAQEARAAVEGAMGTAEEYAATVEHLQDVALTDMEKQRLVDLFSSTANTGHVSGDPVLAGTYVLKCQVVTATGRASIFTFKWVKEETE